MSTTAGVTLDEASPQRTSDGPAKLHADGLPEFELATRHAAYLARKQAKKTRRDGRIDSGAWLSNLQETDQDVAYRFNFVVVGSAARTLVQQMCNSTAAVSLGGGASPTAIAKDGAHRCLCQVDIPVTKERAANRQVAKLSLTTMDFSDQPSGCDTRQEALNTALVYTLCVDSVGPLGVSDFECQLEALAGNLAQLRNTTRPRLRPVKAVLLWCQNSEIGPHEDEWADHLMDFEQRQGGLWKFGPIRFRDPDALHAAFAEMTSARIGHTLSGDDRPGTRQGEDMEADPEPDARALDLEVLFKPSAGLGRISSTGTESNVSEAERPPRFDTEMSGTVCSESAMELHERAFGAFGIQDGEESPHPEVVRNGNPPSAPHAEASTEVATMPGMVQTPWPQESPSRSEATPAEVPEFQKSPSGRSVRVSGADTRKAVGQQDSVGKKLLLRRDRYRNCILC